MGKELSVIANAPPAASSADSLPQEKAGGAPSTGAGDFLAVPGAEALQGRISTDAAAAQPFQRFRRNADALIEPQDNGAEASLQDFAAVPTDDAQKYFTCFVDARNFAKTAPIISKDSRDTLAAAQLHRSKATAQPKQSEAEQGVAKTSVHARLQKTVISPEGQKRFFEDYAARNGYPSAEAPPIDDETLLQNWQLFRSGELKENDFIAPLMFVPMEQRVSVALNLARLVARAHYIESRVFENETLARLDDEIDDAKLALNGSTPGSAEEKRLIAKLNNLDAAYQAEISTLTDDGIAAGWEALERLLGPAAENAPKRQSARLSWTPCQDWSEVDDAVALFQNACDAYNAQTALRKEELLTQQDGMKDSALPLLGMPLELRDGVLARNVHSQAQQNFLESHGLAEPQSRGEKVWQAVKVVGAALGYVFGLAWIFPSVRDALLPTLSQQERTRLAHEHADKTLLTFLEDHNRRLAEEWVKDQYSKPLMGGAGDLQNDVNDAHGLFAAILNPCEQELSNDFMAREKLVEDVKGQLYLAAKSDVLSAQEKRAATLNIPLTDKNVTVADEDYLTDASYLQIMAESIVDGMAAGLHWSARQHQDSFSSPTVEEV